MKERRVKILTLMIIACTACALGFPALGMFITLGNNSNNIGSLPPADGGSPSGPAATATPFVPTLLSTFSISAEDALDLGIAAPLPYDFNHDGKDEILMGNKMVDGNGNAIAPWPIWEFEDLTYLSASVDPISESIFIPRGLSLENSYRTAVYGSGVTGDTPLDDVASFTPLVIADIDGNGVSEVYENLKKPTWLVGNFDPRPGLEIFKAFDPTVGGGSVGIGFTIQTSKTDVLRTTATFAGVAGNMASGDFDADGYDEVALAQTIGHGISVQLLDRNFNLMPGWPKSLPVDVVVGQQTTSPEYPYFMIADLDKNGCVELVLTRRGQTIIYDMAGNVLNTTPIITNRSVNASPVLADVDGDGDEEILLAYAGHSVESGQNFLAFHHDGRPVFGFPLNYASSSLMLAEGPAVGDVDGDGKLELIIRTEIPMSSSYVQIYKLNGQVSSWPMLQRDIGRTGRGQASASSACIVTPVPTATAVPTLTRTPTITPTRTMTRTPTVTSTPTRTRTATPAITITALATSTTAPAPSITPTAVKSPQSIPTVSPAPTSNDSGGGNASCSDKDLSSLESSVKARAKQLIKALNKYHKQQSGMPVEQYASYKKQSNKLLTAALKELQSLPKTVQVCELSAGCNAISLAASEEKFNKAWKALIKHFKSSLKNYPGEAPKPLRQQVKTVAAEVLSTVGLAIPDTYVSDSSTCS